MGSSPTPGTRKAAIRGAILKVGPHQTGTIVRPRRVLRSASHGNRTPSYPRATLVSLPTGRTSAAQGESIDQEVHAGRARGLHQRLRVDTQRLDGGKHVGFRRRGLSLGVRVAFRQQGSAGLQEGRRQLDHSLALQTGRPRSRQVLLHNTGFPADRSMSFLGLHDAGALLL